MTAGEVEAVAADGDRRPLLLFGMEPIETLRECFLQKQRVKSMQDPRASRHNIYLCLSL